MVKYGSMASEKEAKQNSKGKEKKVREEPGEYSPIVFPVFTEAFIAKYKTVLERLKDAQSPGSDKVNDGGE